MHATLQAANCSRKPIRGESRTSKSSSSCILGSWVEESQKTLGPFDELQWRKAPKMVNPSISLNSRCGPSSRCLKGPRRVSCLLIQHWQSCHRSKVGLSCSWLYLNNDALLLNKGVEEKTHHGTRVAKQVQVARGSAQ